MLKKIFSYASFLITLIVPLYIIENHDIQVLYIIIFMLFSEVSYRIGELKYLKIRHRLEDTLNNKLILENPDITEEAAEAGYSTEEFIKIAIEEEKEKLDKDIKYAQNQYLVIWFLLLLLIFII